jgi:hypothetical protein
MELEQKSLEDNMQLNALIEIINNSFSISIKGDSRKRKLVDARVIYAKIARDMGHTFKSIGRQIGKDHSTVIHYMTSFDLLHGSDAEFRRDYLFIKEGVIDVFNQLKDNQEFKKINNVRLLKEQIEKLSLKNEKHLVRELKNERLKEIIKMIDERTPLGWEDYVRGKINSMFNGLVMR